MPLSLHLLGGSTLTLHLDPSEWKAAYDTALRSNSSIELEDPADGGLLGINPHAVLYWKVDPPQAPPTP